MRRRLGRAAHNPARCSSAPMVLAAGQATSGWVRCKCARSLRGPQVGCATRAACTAWAEVKKTRGALAGDSEADQVSGWQP